MFLPGNALMQAISRTLIHSLWQGLIMAVLAGAIALFTKKLKPAARYAMFACLMVCFLIVTGVTFFYELQQLKRDETSVSALVFSKVAAPANTTFTAPGQTAAATPGFAEKIFIFFTTNAKAIVIGWLLIIAFRCVQMLVGLRGVYVLKRKGVADAGQFLNARFAQLRESLHIKQHVQLFQSVIAKVPMAIGHFKPVILLPAGIITALPQDEIEAILLHELAHIRRKDYLVNMLQNFCEIMFFFNPAVLWVSSLIKDERENCCDDIAVNVVQNKKQFIHALISFQEYNIAASKYAPGFPGRKDHLLNRVKRIITNNNKTLTNMEKTFLATGIVLMSFITIAFSQTTRQPDAHNKQQASKEVTAVEYSPDTIPPPAEGAAGQAQTEDTHEQDTTGARHETVNNNDFNLTTNYRGKKYKMVEKDDKLVEFWVNGVKIPEEKFSAYQDVIDTLHNYVVADKKMFALQQNQFKQQQQLFQEQQEHFKSQMDDFKEQQEKFRVDQERWKEQSKDFLKLNDSLGGEQFKLQQEKFKEQMNLYKQQQEKYKLLQKEYKLEADSLYSYNNFELAEPAAPAGPPAPAAPAIAPAPAVSVDIKPLAAIAATASVSVNDPANTITALSVKPLPAVAPVVSIAPVAPVVAQPNKIVNGILVDLKIAGISINDDDVSFTLNNNSLTVNGVAQPEALHNKLRTKYSVGLHDEIKYMTNAGGTRSSISTNLNK